MTKLTNSLTIMAALAATVLACATDGVSLKRTPKVDDIQKYAYGMDFDASGTAGTFTADLAFKVTKVDDTGYVVHHEMMNGIAKVAGSDVQRNVPAYNVTYDALNRVLKVEGEEPSVKTTRFARMVTPVVSDKPVSIGDVWKSEYKEDEALQTPKQENSYKVLATEDLDGTNCTKVSFSHKEAGEGAAELTGTCWFGPDGQVRKFEGDMKNIPIEEFTVNGKMSEKLQK